MSHPAPELTALLDELVPPQKRYLFLRRVLDAAGLPPAHRPDSARWTAPLAEVPLAQVFERLHADFPGHLARVDGVQAQLVPAQERLRRVVPRVPTHLCRVGRLELVSGLLEHPVLLGAGHLHLRGPRGSGRSLVVAQLALEAVERIPVVVFCDGRSPSGLESGLLQLAADLGIPEGPRRETLSALDAWLRAQGDWLVVVDDAPEVLPEVLREAPGRVLTVGVESMAGAHAEVVLPELSPVQRAEVARRWSRGRGSPAELGGLSLGALAVVSAAASRGGGGTTLDAADGVLSADARGLAHLVRAFAPAPIPLPLLTWPEGSPVPALVPPHLHPILRSVRTCRAAAQELVRCARAQWVGDDFLPGTICGTTVTDPRECATAAALVVQALHSIEALPLGFVPHATALCDDPRVPAHLRRALAARTGRLLLAGGDPEAAVEWFQRGLAALDAAEPRLEAALLNDLGVAWRRAGRLDEAAAVLTDALHRDTTAVPTDVLAVAATRTNLGHVRREQGDMLAAHDLYRAAHRARREALGPTHRQTAAVAIQLGVAARALGLDDDARLVWSEAIQVLVRARPPEPRLLADALLNHARLDADEGRVREATAGAERAHALLVALHDDLDHPEVVEVRRLVGALDLQT